MRGSSHLAAAALSCGHRLRAPQQAPVFRGGVDLVNLGVTVTDQQGQPRRPTSRPTTSRSTKTARQQTVQLLRRRATPTAGGAADCTSACCSTSARAWTTTSRFTRTRRDQVPEHADRRGGHHARRLRHRGARRALQPERTSPRLVERIRQQKAAGRHGALRRDRRLSRRRRRPGRPEDHAALHRRRRHAQRASRFSELLDLLKASDVTVYAIGVLEHQSPSAARSSSGCVLQQIADATGGQAFFPTVDRRTSTASTSRSLAEIRAQYTLGYVSTNDKTDGALAEGRDQGRRGQGRKDLRRPLAARATSRRTEQQPRAPAAALREPATS